MYRENNTDGKDLIKAVQQPRDEASSEESKQPLLAIVTFP